jgi:AraC family transcriptional regulator
VVAPPRRTRPAGGVNVVARRVSITHSARDPMQSPDSLAPAMPHASQAAPAVSVRVPACASPLAVAWREITPGVELHDERDAVVILVPLERTSFRLAVAARDGLAREMTVADPDVCVLAPGAVHGIVAAQHAALAVLCLDRAWWEGGVRTVLGHAARMVDCHVGPDALVRHVAGRLAGAARSGTPPHAARLEAAAADLAMHLATRFARPLEGSRQPMLAPERLERVLALIEEKLAEAIQVRDLAVCACMSPYHFARLFKQATGQAPHLYITWQRMDRAKVLLAQSDLPLAQVARRVGYHTQAHFTGVFHARVGTTPRAYRVRCRAI